MRPSNSGTATWVATSSGLMPSSLPTHWARELVRHSPCRIGMSRAARCSTFQLSSSPPADDGRRVAPPGGQHGGHHARRRVPSSVQQLGFGGAQRCAVHRQRPCRPPSSMACAQRLDVAGVAGQLLGAVVQHRDASGRRFGDRARRRSSTPQVGMLTGGVETDPGHQHGVGQERVQLAQVLDAALREVDVRLHRDACGDRGVAHQFGVGRLLPADARRSAPRWRRTASIPSCQAR